MLLTAKLIFFTEKLNFTLLKEDDFKYVTSTWKAGDKKREGGGGWWPKNDTGSKATGQDTQKKKNKPPIGRQQAEQFPPPTWRQHTLAWIERILHGGLLFLSNCLGLRDPPWEV